jgi:hypothetical protein
MAQRSELLKALDDAMDEVGKERSRIAALTKGVPEPESRQIWDEERSQILPYLEEETEVEETNLILHDARQYHLSVPDLSAKDAWEVSRMTHRRFLVPSARRQIQRALLEENGREADNRRSKWSLFIGMGGLFIAAIALLKDVPFGAFILDFVNAVKADK